jgi:lipoprotein-releasing system ATP-binding protein
MNNKFSLKLLKVTKTFAGLDVPVLEKLSMEIKQSERVAISGDSGSGKSTLLHLMAGLDNPDSGRVELNDRNFIDLNEKQLSVVRNNHIGFVYQSHHLLKDFTAIENIMMPLVIKGGGVEKYSKISKEIIKKLGLGSRINHFPYQLSGGERQRVAIARAMITSPDIILADEPTGNLDHKNANIVFDLFLEMAIDTNSAIVLVTHNLSLAKKMNKIYHLTQGKLQAN